MRAAIASRMTHEIGDANAKLNLWHADAETRFCNADFDMPSEVFDWRAARKFC